MKTIFFWMEGLSTSSLSCLNSAVLSGVVICVVICECNILRRYHHQTSNRASGGKEMGDIMPKTKTRC